VAGNPCHSGAGAILIRLSRLALRERALRRDFSCGVGVCMGSLDDRRVISPKGEDRTHREDGLTGDEDVGIGT
jgi:hypothetical protein